MRKVETKICRNCKKSYLWESGGIIVSPEDFADFGLCSKCRGKSVLKTIGKILGGKK